MMWRVNESKLQRTKAHNLNAHKVTLVSQRIYLFLMVSHSERACSAAVSSLDEVNSGQKYIGVSYRCTHRT